MDTHMNALLVGGPKCDHTINTQQTVQIDSSSVSSMGTASVSLLRCHLFPFCLILHDEPTCYRSVIVGIDANVKTIGNDHWTIVPARIVLRVNP